MENKIFTSKPRSIKVDQKYRKEREEAKKSRVTVVLGEMIKKTVGGRHAYFQSNVGIVRKLL